MLQWATEGHAREAQTCSHHRVIAKCQPIWGVPADMLTSPLDLAERNPQALKNVLTDQ